MTYSLERNEMTDKLNEIRILMDGMDEDRRKIQQMEVGIVVSKDIIRNCKTRIRKSEKRLSKIKVFIEET